MQKYIKNAGVGPAETASFQHNGDFSESPSGLFAAWTCRGQGVHVKDMLGPASTLALRDPFLRNFPALCSGGKKNLSNDLQPALPTWPKSKGYGCGGGGRVVGDLSPTPSPIGNIVFQT